MGRKITSFLKDAINKEKDKHRKKMRKQVLKKLGRLLGNQILRRL